ncbi:Px domain-containing protein erel1 [Thalictrum thalictroides]|uniref:Px domain-containing protein erel1 n=1 Tax=Thalictrum thalictroides TaxID=46969 RepID=A0A7J6WRU5_THATH|nr:Px domain-containing protein erel1 [Thalictrum thalictroides]
MQKQQSPPKHRHDGTSPLPLGMDWSPPPKKWDGRDTVWPHDPRSGWSYCVTIPSWVTLPRSRDADGVVYYRVQVGIQSPEGITTIRGVLRRFSDFMRLTTELKRTYPRKNLPPAPPKHILRVNSNRSLPEERRCSLEEWMGKLLSDIEISRSVLVASFLELEAAARSSFQNASQQPLEANPPGNGIGSIQPSSGLSVVVGSSSITDYGSDTAYETSEVGTPRGRDNSSEIGLEDLVSDQDITTPIQALVKYGISNIDSGLFAGESILEQLEGFPKHKMHGKKVNSITDRDTYNGNTSSLAILSGERMEPDHGKLGGHARKYSAESVGSDTSSIRGSDLSNAGVANSFGDGSVDFGGGAEAHTTVGSLGSSDLQLPNDVQVVLPFDQRHKLNRVLITMQRRIGTAKTDMEDVLARLNQETAVKEYLTTKVKDLEVELETTIEKSKENLQQAILIERERLTQMQWDMEELRRKSLEMESKLKAEQDERARTTSVIQEKDSLVQELDYAKEKLVKLQKLHEELQLKSKADTKVLVKEVKSLRNSQAELKQELGRSQKEKSELERVLQREKQRTDHVKNARAKLLHECGILRQRLHECSVNFLAEEEDKFTVDSSSLSDALDLLTTSDNRIGLLLAEAQLLAQEDENSVSSASRSYNSNGVDVRTTDDDIRKMLTDIFIDNARLRKQVNSVIRCALKTTIKSEKDEETPSRKTVLNKFLER